MVDGRDTPESYNNEECRNLPILLFPFIFCTMRPILRVNNEITDLPYYNLKCGLNGGRFLCVFVCVCISSFSSGKKNVRQGK